MIYIHRGKKNGGGDGVMGGWERPTRAEQHREKKAVAVAVTNKKAFRGKVMR